MAMVITVPVSGEQIKATGTMEVYFSPRGGATEAVVREIDHARREILVQAYSFTSPKISQALVQAWNVNRLAKLTHHRRPKLTHPSECF